MASLVLANPDVRWGVCHPMSIRDIVRVHEVASRVRAYRAAQGHCPPSSHLRDLLNTRLEYRIWSDLVPEECVLSFEEPSTGFDVEKHHYFVVRDFWAQTGDMFRGGKVWQHLSKAERARVDVRAASLRL